MSKSFIQQVIQQVPKGNEAFSTTIVLLPTKRACQYFRDCLLEEFPSESVWLPTILSIEDFLYQHAPLTISPDDELLVVLHRIHAQITQQEQNFASFYKWGQMILKDFNEIDQYLIDTDYLFHYVKEFKEIETESLLTEEQTALLNQFWDSLPRERNSKVRQNFLQTWESLGTIYSTFNSVLEEQGKAYQGKAYRALLKDLEAGTTRFKWANFMIVGFNALSSFEERLFQLLCREYETKIYWDVKESWLNDRQAEPGLFIRKYVNLFPEKANVFISTDQPTIDQKMNIEVVEVGMDTLQPDLAMEMVRKWGSPQTAIVLCDETLVFPLTFQLGNVEEANVTMGFPASMSAITTFIKDSLDLKSYWINSKRISPSILLKVLGFAGLRSFLPHRELFELENRINRWGFINKKDIVELFGSDHVFFTELLSKDNVLLSIISILQLLPDGADKGASNRKIGEGLIAALEEMRAWMETFKLQLSVDDLWPVLKNRIGGLKIPFEHGGSNGLQIMGFLETRNLDFKNIIILSADDKHLPGTNKHASFIPYTIKKGLQMPTYRENDAIYSYHFFRLLKRAENVALIYSPQANGMKQSRSRFIEQILYEWKLRNGEHNLDITESSLQVPVPKADVVTAIRIDKQEPKVKAGLQRFIDGEKQFSASSLITHIQCPFQFYLKNVAGLAEPETFTEDYDQGDLGRVFHTVMELFYKPSLDAGELLSREKITAYIKTRDFNALIQEAFDKENYGNNILDLKGQNLLVSDIILKLMQAVLKKDMESEPFKIVGLELKLEDVELKIDDQRSVRLKGFLDRVDEVHSESEGKFIRIVDYKTGSASIASSARKEPEDYFRTYFESAKNKEGFQGYLYGWMFNKQHPGNSIKVAFYSAKALSNGLLYLSSGNVITNDQFSIFEHYLVELVEDILDIGVPFIQSEDENAYQYSAYSVLVE